MHASGTSDYYLIEAIEICRLIKGSKKNAFFLEKPANLKPYLDEDPDR